MLGRCKFLFVICIVRCGRKVVNVVDLSMFVSGVLVMMILFVVIVLIRLVMLICECELNVSGLISCVLICCYSVLMCLNFLIVCR